jgi:hypothetical protein
MVGEIQFAGTSEDYSIICRCEQSEAISEQLGDCFVAKTAPRNDTGLNASQSFSFARAVAGQWQMDGERTAGIDAALRLYAPAVRFGNRAHERQPQPRAAS